MPDANITDIEIEALLTNLIKTARKIKDAVNELDGTQLKAKSTGSDKYSNQYQIDVIADEIIHNQLHDFPGYILSEERQIDKATMEASSLVLVVDPIDGSTNAAHGINYWCFSAALVFLGKVIAAVVVDQTNDRTFIARKNKPAEIIDSNGTMKILDPKSFPNSNVGTPADNFSSAVINFSTHEGPSIPFRHLRHFGASALSICDVAAGNLDAYIDDEDVMLKPWDLLAAEFIARSAGCEVLRRDSQGIMAASGVLVTRSKSLLRDFEKLFPHFFQ